MSNYNQYCIMPLIGYPSITLNYFMGCYVNKDLDKLYIECVKKDDIHEEYFYYDNRIFYVIPLDKKLKHIVKLMYEGKWKEFLLTYPEEVIIINKTSGLKYYAPSPNNPNSKISHGLLLKLNRNEDGYVLTKREYELFNVDLDIEDEYLPPLNDDKMNYIEQRIKDNYQEEYKEYTKKLEQRNQFKITKL